MTVSKKKWHRGASALFAGVAGLIFAADGHAQSAPPPPAGGNTFLSGLKPIIDARLRYENVEQAGFANDANAVTLRVRAGVQTGKIAGFSLLAEAEGIAHLTEDFNDTINGKTTLPTIADPDGLELNRLQIDYTGLEKTAFTVGRQRINLDNQRFVGAVGFRQNEQTFDAARVTTTIVPNLDATYIFFNQVNRVFGHKSPQGEFTGDSHLINAGYAIPNIGKLTAYSYLLDFNESQTLSTASYGLRFAGKYAINKDVAVVYEAEYAKQKDYKDNPLNLNLDYLHGEAGATWKGFSALGGVESLEGNGVRGFATPLATLHKWQGYADVFLTTPADGIVDWYGKVGYETPVSWGPATAVSGAVWYHGYSAERGGRDLGDELNIEARVGFGKQFALFAKYADYNGVPGFASRSKFWLALEFIY
jgi:hypothetical protein